MFFELIAAVVAGVAVGGIATLLRWVSRGVLPRWIVPAAAGVGMLSYAVWSEYSWFGRVTERLPAEVAVAWHNGDTAFWRPWSYFRPVVNRFTAVDRRTEQRHPDMPGQVMVDLVLAARWQQSARLKVVFDCNGARRADLTGQDVSIGENGAIVGAKWIDLPADDAVLATACKSG